MSSVWIEETDGIARGIARGGHYGGAIVKQGEVSGQAAFIRVDQIGAGLDVVAVSQTIVTLACFEACPSGFISRQG